MQGKPVVEAADEGSGVQPVEGGGEEKGEEDAPVADDGADEWDCGAKDEETGEGEDRAKGNERCRVER